MIKILSRITIKHTLKKCIKYFLLKHKKRILNYDSQYKLWVARSINTK